MASKHGPLALYGSDLITNFNVILLLLAGILTKPDSVQDPNLKRKVRHVTTE